jgi:hypothetical protein
LEDKEEGPTLCLHPPVVTPVIVTLPIEVLNPPPSVIVSPAGGETPPKPLPSSSLISLFASAYQFTFGETHLIAANSVKVLLNVTGYQFSAYTNQMAIIINSVAVNDLGCSEAGYDGDQMRWIEVTTSSGASLFGQFYQYSLLDNTPPALLNFRG